MSYEHTAASPGDTTRHTVTAFFDDRAYAQRAVDRLFETGIRSEDVRLVPGAASGRSPESAPQEERSLWEQLKDFIMPDEDRQTYAEGLRRGGYLVTVTAAGESYDRALDILDDEGSVDMGQRETEWRSKGWAGRAVDEPSSAARAGRGALETQAGRTAASAGEQVIPVAEEELRVGKRDVSHGRVRVRSYVVESPVSEQLGLRDERVSVERRPVDRPASGQDQVFQERTIEAEEHAEEPVVAKEARVKEEVVVGKDVGQRTETVSGTVRRTEVDVDDERGGRGTSPSSGEPNTGAKKP